MDTSDAELFAAQFHWLDLVQADIPESGERFLELGFGHSPVSSCLLTSIFSKGVALEPSEAWGDNYNFTFQLCEYIFNDIPKLLPTILKNRTYCNNGISNKLLISRKYLEDMTFPDNYFDFCFSRVVLNQVQNVEKLSKEMYRVLKPKGIMLHTIAFNDISRCGVYDFDFLKYTKDEWGEMSSSSTNLCRINDFINLWESLGFRTEIIDRNNTNLLPEIIHPCWEKYSMEDLLCLDAVIKAEKIE